MEDKIFSIARAAEYLDVFPLTLRNWERKGKIRAFRTPGGHRRYRKSDLDFLLGIAEEEDIKLTNTIKNLETLNFTDSRQERLSRVINELRDISKNNHTNEDI